MQRSAGLVLPVNDQVTNMCLRFERYERMRRGVLDKKDKSSGVETKTAENTEASSMFSAMPNKLNGTTPAGYRDDDFVGTLSYDCLYYILCHTNFLIHLSVF